MKRTRMARVMTGLALMAGLFAGTASPATAQIAVGPVSLVTYNVCGGWEKCRSTLALQTGKTPQQRADDWAAGILAEARLAGTDVIMLQELCKGQYDALVSKLTGYAGHFASRQTYVGCDAWGSDTSLGQAVLFRGATAEQISPSSVEVKVPNDTRLAVCAKGPLSGRHTLACSVHLSQPTVEGGMPELLGHIQAQAGGASVIVAGDFNHRPPQIPAALRAGVPAGGPLAEADAADNAPTTLWQEGKGYTAKFDHAFFSTEDFGPGTAEVEDPQLAGVKDHALLRAFAFPRKPVPGDLTGDGRPDLLAVRKDGALRLYPGRGDGGFGSSRVLAPTGFLGAVVSHRGDWTGDGREDILARMGDGLYVYPNPGDGTLGTPMIIPNREDGWGDTAPRAVGDIDGDGRSDLAVQSPSGLWLHRGGIPATGPSLPHAAAQIGGTEWVTGGDLDLLAPGDTTEPAMEYPWLQRADLWARRRTSGQLNEYAGNGAAPLAGPRTLTGDTWTAAQRPLVTSLGDGNGDGVADLWFTTAYDSKTGLGGDLHFQPGTATGWGTPVLVGNSGWGYTESLS